MKSNVIFSSSTIREHGAESPTFSLYTRLYLLNSLLL